MNNHVLGHRANNALPFRSLWPFCIWLPLGFVGLLPYKNIALLADGSPAGVWTFLYQLSIATIAYSLDAEISIRYLRVKTVPLFHVGYNLAAIIVNVLTPYMIDPTVWNWDNFAAFFWATTCFCVLIYRYFRLPEPCDRTFAEMDLPFERRIFARDFKTTNVDAFYIALQNQIADDKLGASHLEKV